MDSREVAWRVARARARGMKLVYVLMWAPEPYDDDGVPIACCVAISPVDTVAIEMRHLSLN